MTVNKPIKQETRDGVKIQSAWNDKLQQAKDTRAVSEKPAVKRAMLKMPSPALLTRNSLLLLKVVGRIRNLYIAANR
jgi:hypothetical protein